MDLQNPGNHMTTLVRPNTEAVVGGAFGDEGKGRIIDNLIENLFKRPGVKSVYVIRYQGGNNAGHTIEKDGITLALHVVPSFVLYPKAKGIMDRGEVIHPEDLQTEVEYIEKRIKWSLIGKLFLSQDAILCSDLERAEEILNRAKSGDAKGGTGRGISPSYAHFIDRTGFTIRHLLSPDWQKVFGHRYDMYEKLFAAFSQELDGKKLADIAVPDFKNFLRKNTSVIRTVGSKKIFLSRLAATRAWLKKREMVINIEPLYRKIHNDPSVGILFEGSQAAGLDAYNGTRPDVTSSDTTLSGIKAGTGGHWVEKNLSDSYAVIKATYTSSVGERKMPTHVKANTSPKATTDEKWAAWVQEAAHEYGTTTGRPRDITILDLEMLTFNLKISGAEKVVVTHLDIARENQDVKVCTHYTNKNGQRIPYQPNLADLALVIPHYTTLPGWDGNACQQARTFKELPPNAKRYLTFLEKSLGYPIAGATTGPDRQHLIMF